MTHIPQGLVTTSLLALLMALAGCGSADEQTRAAAERAEQRIQQSHRVASSGVIVEPQAQTGTVTLRGRVGSLAERQHAEDIARRTQGVQTVENQLTLAERGLWEDAPEGEQNRRLALAGQDNR